MSSLTNYYGFPSASKSRETAMGQNGNNNVTIKEINLIENAIVDSASNSQLEVSISTQITSDINYFRAYNDPYHYDTSADKLKRGIMESVMNYFIRLGYSIKRERVGNTETFSWVVKW